MKRHGQACRMQKTVKYNKETPSEFQKLFHESQEEKTAKQHPQDEVPPFPQGAWEEGGGREAGGGERGAGVQFRPGLGRVSSPLSSSYNPFVTQQVERSVLRGFKGKYCDVRVLNPVKFPFYTGKKAGKD